MDVEKDDPIARRSTDVAARPPVGGPGIAESAEDATGVADSIDATDVGDPIDATDPGDVAVTDSEGAVEQAERTETDGDLTPAAIARRLCEGFVHHDERERGAAIEAFADVDAFQFAHVDRATARQAARAYADALWAKDAVEDRCRDGGVIDPDALVGADWSAVESALAERAALVGIDPEYPTLTVEGWRRHKVGGDYWTPHLRAQQLELQAALQDPSYPDKPRHGNSGSGPEATRYLLGVELHDCRRWEEAHAVMVPYFERIARIHDED